jgi:aspartyl-tRNA(Asn)/glutamyl-tRNA(Gln) amidotransferase subunit C
MKIDVAHIAKLANLPLTVDEKNKFEKQLSAILGHFEKLSEVPTDKIEETSQVTGLTNVTRIDEVTPSLSQDEALVNTKNVHNGMFVVPVILEEESEG